MGDLRYDSDAGYLCESVDMKRTYLCNAFNLKVVGLHGSFFWEYVNFPLNCYYT